MFETERRLMVELQLRARGIDDQRVLDAFLRVPRHEFVPASFIEEAYEDRPLPIGIVETISQPYMVAAMTVAARVAEGDKALEVGTGSGYQAAILAELGAEVVSVELNLRLAQEARERLRRLDYTSITIITGDGTEGYAQAAPYDAVLVTAASPRIPPPLLEQLAVGGRLVIPVGDRIQQEIQCVLRTSEGFTTTTLDPCQFVPLVGHYGWPVVASTF
jgi:protein-L-isoaspartate(D-aspartate) O-methyltransferase